MSEPKKKFAAFRRKRGSGAPWQEFAGVTGDTHAEVWDALMKHTELARGGEPGEEWEYAVVAPGQRPAAGQAYRHRAMGPRGF